MPKKDVKWIRLGPNFSRNTTPGASYGRLELAQEVHLYDLHVERDLTVGRDTVIHGNLTVNGTTVTLNTEEWMVEDHNITLGNIGTPTDNSAYEGGLTLRGATDKTFKWIDDLTQDSGGVWVSSEGLSAGGSGYYVGTTQVIDEDGNWVGPAISTEGISLKSLSSGIGLTGGSYNGSSDVTFNVDFGSGNSQVARGNHTHDLGDLGDVSLTQSTPNLSLLYYSSNDDEWKAGDLATLGIEPAFTKNSAFNKSFGNTPDTVAPGNHNHDSVYGKLEDTQHTNNWNSVQVFNNDVGFSSQVILQTNAAIRFGSGSTPTGYLTGAYGNYLPSLALNSTSPNTNYTFEVEGESLFKDDIVVDGKIVIAPNTSLNNDLSLFEFGDNTTISGRIHYAYEPQGTVLDVIKFEKIVHDADPVVTKLKIDADGSLLTGMKVSQISGAVPTSRSISTSGGLTGGGNLSSNRTISIADGGVSTTKIADDAVTFDKLLNATSGASIIGRSASTGGAYGEIKSTQAGEVLIRSGSNTLGFSRLGTDDIYTEGSNLWFTAARARNAITGAASTITSSNLTANRVLVSNASGKVVVSSITSEELDALDGIDSNIQDQIDRTNLEVISFELQETHINTSKYVVLPSTPKDPEKVVLQIEGAPSMRNGPDFTVSFVSNQWRLSWGSSWLDGVLEEDDFLTVIYEIDYTG